MIITNILKIPLGRINLEDRKKETQTNKQNATAFA
jgi:hypothetical protein